MRAETISSWRPEPDDYTKDFPRRCNGATAACVAPVAVRMRKEVARIRAGWQGSSVQEIFSGRPDFCEPRWFHTPRYRCQIPYPAGSRSDQPITDA